MIVIVSRNFHTCTLNLVLPSPPLYPRASIAVAKSSARLKEDTNNGISIGITAFTYEPSPKLTPLERWAFIILAVSSIKVGTNLNAIESIREISYTGTFKYFNGFNNDSIASEISNGDVVNVNKVDITIIKTNLKNT